MPFWQQVQRCEHCKFWKRDDPSSPIGTCMGQFEVKRRPFWVQPVEFETRWDEGTACSAYKHDRHKEHPLDGAREYLMLVEKGDMIPMRTYRLGEVDHTMAELVSRNSKHLIVKMLNGTWRIRLDGTEQHKGGTVMGMEEWGIDPERKVEYVRRSLERPERAVEILAKVQPGDTINLIGYPPFNEMRMTARVLTVTDKYVTIRIRHYRRKSKMHARGVYAGIIEGELFTLDTTEQP